LIHKPNGLRTRIREMNTKHLKAFVGRGVKVHIGYEIDLGDDRKIVRVRCGSRSAGTKIYAYGELDLATYADNRNNCEKCIAQIKDKLSA
jgi:hypothetical protein